MRAGYNDHDRYLVLATLISYIFSASPDRKASKGLTYKILFELKNQLPKDNPIKNELPYYWYFYGPNSDYLNEIIEKMKIDHYLSDFPLPDGRPLLLLTSRPKDYTDEHVEYAIETLNKILGELNFRNNDPFRKQIYLKYAPFDIQKLYKIKFFDELERFIRLSELLKLQSMSQSEIVEFNVLDKHKASLEQLLYKCELKVPDYYIFDDFEEIFSTYVTSAINILDHVEEYNSIEQSALNFTLQEYSRKTWNTLAKGIRIPPEGHDPHYEDLIGGWENEFNSTVSQYSEEIETFYGESNSCLSSKVKDPCNLTHDSKKILTSIVNGYFSGGN